MPQKCRSCGARIIKFPIWNGQEKGEPFSWDKVIWINLFKVDMMAVLFFIAVIVLMVGYKLDMEQCRDAIERPCEFCKTTNCCQVNWAAVEPEKAFGNTAMNIPVFNNTIN